MDKLLALPCMQVWTNMSYPDNMEYCKDWREAVQLAKSLVPKIILNPSGPVFRNYFLTPYAQFNWKLRTQYHFCRYKEFLSPWDPPRFRCVYLGKVPFRWSKGGGDWPEPINVYPLFKGIKMLEDGTPDVLFKNSWWGWSFPPDPMFYTGDEWKTVTDWEKIVFVYNHRRAICIAKYDMEGKHVRHTITGQVGEVVDVLRGKRETELWNPGTPSERRAVLQKHWMKMRPLSYKVQMADKEYFYAPRKLISMF